LGRGGGSRRRFPLGVRGGHMRCGVRRKEVGHMSRKTAGQLLGLGKRNQEGLDGAPVVRF